jgi:hypothetical protein
MNLHFICITEYILDISEQISAKLKSSLLCLCFLPMLHCFLRNWRNYQCSRKIIICIVELITLFRPFRVITYYNVLPSTLNHLCWLNYCVEWAILLVAVVSALLLSCVHTLSSSSMALQPGNGLGLPYGFSWWLGMYDVRLSAPRSTFFWSSWFDHQRHLLAKPADTKWRSRWNRVRNGRWIFPTKPLSCS